MWFWSFFKHMGFTLYSQKKYVWALKVLQATALRNRHTVPACRCPVEDQTPADDGGRILHAVKPKLWKVPGHPSGCPPASESQGEPCTAHPVLCTAKEALQFTLQGAFASYSFLCSSLF